MALKLHGMKETFEVEVSIDSALDMTDEEYAAYIATCDSNLLKCHEGEVPHKFLLRRVLPNNLATKLQSHIKYKPQQGTDGVNVDFFAYIREEVRCALVGVINPPNCAPEDEIKYVAASDGGAHEDLVAQLAEAGALMDLFNARQMKQAKKIDKKK